MNEIETQKIITNAVEFVKGKLSDESGHDWTHVERVWHVAITIAKEEKADLFITQLGALLHDVADWKFHGHDFTVGPKVTREWLSSQNVEAATIDAVCHIVENVSFKGAGEANKMKSLEGKIVQDADRIDAIGAMGIARCFSYGGKTNRPFHDASEKPIIGDFSTYRNAGKTTINHFYEKLLLLKDMMNTVAGRKMAEHRHKVMEQYLEEFYDEWEGKK
ncbi:MAG: HD domain-containing protein [Candidatus Micrarchaeota archaeon]